MIETKRAIIQDEGVPVTIHDAKGTVLHQTVALVGKATKQFASEISLESHRQGQFFPELDVHSGLLVKNDITDEVYIVVASYPEVIERQKCTIVTRMVVCNSTITVHGMERDADKKGNIKQIPVERYTNLSVYAEAVDSKVNQKDPGKAQKVIYRVYAPRVKLDIEDRIDMDNGFGDIESFKLEGHDLRTFKGLSLIDMVTDTRRP